MIDRGTFLSGSLAALASSGAPGPGGFRSSVLEIERAMRGTIGVCAVRAGGRLSYREDERFAYCSTFKWILGAAILALVERGAVRLDQQVAYGKSDLVHYAPVTSKHVGAGHLSVGDLCAAMIEVSDNTAANLLESLAGGLPGLRAFTASFGDRTIRFDRPEPALNTNLPGDPRDTTTPLAMSSLLERVFTGPGLSQESRDQLFAWMRAATTGTDRIRASVPAGWSVGDKTGTGDNGAINDVAVVRPPSAVPIYLAVFTSGTGRDSDAHSAAIAAVAKAVFTAWGAPAL
jgi:beta-lactamase class A